MALLPHPTGRGSAVFYGRRAADTFAHRAHRRDARHAIAAAARDPRDRARSQATVLIDDHRISRRHAAIRLAPQEAFLVDLGSTNGTWCNGQPVGAETRLADGDRIRLGLVEVRYCDPAAADTVPVNDFRNLPLLSRTLHRHVLVPGGAGIPQVRTPAPMHADRSVTAPIDEPVPAADH